ncbi:hypothetical protein [Halalkalibacterium ligniniphilum]|uniref:hypothetical protein n=1 Tax=Halalkalibacterium ligniniphilum TaxID=1134413 RepID=UPI00034AA2A9|nr:hypothetical protein [Halalkalibacterium ligniniphilum]
MDSNRKDIIVREINYWKQSKLLPEHYCDFLLTLYTEGEQEESKKFSRKLKMSKRSIFLLASVIGLFLLTLLVIYFTDFSIAMQIGFGFFLTCFVLYLGYQVRLSNQSLAHLAYFMAALLLFVLTLKGVHSLFGENRLTNGVTVLIHCSAWMFIGWKWKIPYFLLAGGASMILLLYFWFV